MPDGTPAGLDLATLRADLADVTGERPEDIADDDDLRDLGLDSIRLMSLVETWRARGVKVELTDLVEIAPVPTLRSWAAHLAP
ncbi:phosphopantetheine-binding protein [Kitasatospora sp. NPDC057015]|uniref:phosphopantetheine-binding protein n=1 Tax=Kitasatospora sp. NPDC057015 TaxID=3346001 RepID=UPI00363F576B